MIGVYIEGLEEPKDCMHCPVKHWDERKYVCPFNGYAIPVEGKLTYCRMRDMSELEKHGKWIIKESDYGFGKEAVCSHCGMTFWDWMRLLGYCPNCGAVMDED